MPAARRSGDPAPSAAATRRDGEPPPVGKGGLGGEGRCIDAANLKRGEEGEGRERPRVLEQGAAQHPVLDDPAERRIGAQFAMIVMQK